MHVRARPSVELIRGDVPLLCRPGGHHRPNGGAAVLRRGLEERHPAGIHFVERQHARQKGPGPGLFTSGGDRELPPLLDPVAAVGDFRLERAILALRRAVSSPVVFW